MGGIELREDALLVDREPNELDDLAVRFSGICEALGIDHVYVAGYVAILAGRSRATQDIDVLLEPVDDGQADELAERLGAEGFWGPAMPLSEMATMLSAGDNIWVARDGEMVPHLEVKEVSDRFDRASLRNAIEGRIGNASVPIGPLELQTAYKLHLGTRKHFEDTVHLYTMFDETLSNEELQLWVERLGVEDEYERLKTA